MQILLLLATFVAALESSGWQGVRLLGQLVDGTAVCSVPGLTAAAVAVPVTTGVSCVRAGSPLLVATRGADPRVVLPAREVAVCVSRQEGRLSASLQGPIPRARQDWLSRDAGAPGGSPCLSGGQCLCLAPLWYGASRSGRKGTPSCSAPCSVRPRWTSRKAGRWTWTQILAALTSTCPRQRSQGSSAAL